MMFQEVDMTINEISSTPLNYIKLAQNEELTVSPLDKASATLPVDSAVIQFMMQQFMNDMYSSVEECPYSVTYKPEW